MKTTTEILHTIKARNYIYDQKDNQLRIATTADPKTTHVLYCVHKDRLAWYKSIIKQLGGKYIRSISSGYNKYYNICFNANNI